MLDQHLITRMNRRQTICYWGATLLSATLPAYAVSEFLPRGLLINYTFEDCENGFIRNKAPFPIHTPLGSHIIELSDKKRPVLLINKGQYLEPPASSILNPKESNWVILMRVRPLSDGLLFSQGNAENHLAICIVMGIPVVQLMQNGEAFIMRGKKSSIGHWMTLSVEIKSKQLTFSVNRQRIGLIYLQNKPYIKASSFRLGYQPEIYPQGIKAQINSLKLIRQ